MSKKKMEITMPAAIIALVLLALCATPSVWADAINLGQAANYAVLGIGGTNTKLSQFEVYQSGTVVNGNVGVGPYSTWTHGMDATINGTLYYDTTDGLPSITGTITGGTIQQSMLQAVNDAVSASSFASSLTPTQTYSTFAENQVITGNGGQNVVRVTGDVALKKGLTLSGSASDTFIIQLTANDATSAHQLVLSGMTMTLTGGVTPNNIVWVLNDGGGNIQITSGADVYGTFLAPDRSITVDHGTVNGRVIAGGSPNPADGSINLLSIHSTSTINGLSEVPEPGTLAMMGTGVVGLAGLLRRKLRG
jgi:choice-of-anchor A domain-containing protein